MTLVCIGDEYGRLGNRLVRAAHVLAFCREWNFAFLDLPFAPYANNLATSASSIALSSPRVPVPSVVARRLHQRLAFHGPRVAHRISQVPTIGPLVRRFVHNVTLPAGDRIDLSRPELADEFQRYRIVVLRGWYFRCYSLVQAHADWLRTFLRPNISESDRACQSIRQSRAAGRFVVGVHIRGGDYRTWREGRFFYPLDFYLKQMRIAAFELASQDVKFLISSDEAIDQSQLNEFDCILTDGNIVSDLAALSHCDMIFGPPSSFSLWASFLGQVDLWHMTSPDETFSFDCFSQSSDLNWVLEQQ